MGMKLSQKFSEPYVVVKVLPNDRYGVKRIDGRGRPKKMSHDNLRSAPKFGGDNLITASAMNEGYEDREEALLD